MCFNFCFCFFTWDSYKYSKLFSKIKKHDKIVLNNIYSYSGYDISFDTRGTFSLSNGAMLIWAHLCMLIIKKDMLILGKGSTQGLVDTTLTAEAEYPFRVNQTKKEVLF